MGPVDFLLNLAGLLLWLNWRARHFDPLAHSTPATLVGTLKRAEARPLAGWTFPAGVAVLVCGRTLIYLWLGPPVGWTPKLHLGVIVLAFRSDALSQVFWFSALSFLRFTILAYFWILTLACLNRNVPDGNPFLRLLRLHLGKARRWPWLLQMPLLPLASAILWMACAPLLARLDILNPARSTAHLAEQGLLIGFGLFLSLKYLLPALLLLHLVASYVYLGSSPFWEFLDGTARNLLAPLRGLPLRFGRVDFGPVLGVALLLLLLQLVPNNITPWLVEKLTHKPPHLWPQ
jgi:uncharacterized protein YggT (Ycf19 family)